MTRPATIKGQVAAVMFGADNTYMLIDVKDARGKSRLWAVQGNGLGVLTKDGWTPKGAVRPGDAVSVVTFRPRYRAKLLRACPSNGEFAVGAVCDRAYFAEKVGI